MRYEATFETDAPPVQVWAALTDVESWPRRMSSYTSVRRLDSGPLRFGSLAPVEQSGPLAGLIGLALGRKIRRYLQIEVRGLCDASEVGQ